MCPIIYKSICEDQGRHKCSKRTSLPRSIPHEERHDSGLDSINLQSFPTFETDVSSLQNTFLNMTINGHQISNYDSGVYTSVPYSTRRCSQEGNIDTICDIECTEEDISVDSSFPCQDTNQCQRRDSGMQLHVRAEQIAGLFEGDKDGDNRLHLSIINGQEVYTLILINLAPDYDCLSFGNLLRQTPLHLAVLTRQARIVRRLVCAGATVLAQDKQGDTPLHIACRLGDTEIVKQLLTPINYEETLQNRHDIPYQRMPQDLRVRNYEGQTCLHVAASYGHHNVVQMLLETGADINMGDGKSGRAVLHLAVDRGDMELVELLLSYGDINVKKQDYAGLTSIQLAYGRNHMNIVKFIYCLSGEYEGVGLSDPDISLLDEDWSDDSSDCCDT